MINIVDNFLESEIYHNVYRSLKNNEFSHVEIGDKDFWIQYSNSEFDDLVIKKISDIEGVDRECIVGFFRVATDNLDTDWRIHSDSKVGDTRPNRALVLYISPSTMNGLHGTAFWKHKKHGYQMPLSISDEETDDILLNQSNVIDNWELHSVVGYKENRAVMYPSNYFHSKYPNVGWKEGRMVYVMFYK
jgi:hypothetical protein